MQNTPPVFKAHVLLVDDDFMVGTSVSELLTYHGFKADYAANQQEALEYLEENPGTDIVLLDINFDCGKTGIEMVPLIRESCRYAQIIMFTSEDKLTTGIECMQAGAFDYMTKPFDDKMFINKVPGALERKKALQLNDLYLGILFHDLKNPLQGIMATFELLKMSLSKTDLSDLQKTAFYRADVAINQILMMINNILAVSKFENNMLAARRERICLQREVDHALSLNKAEESMGNGPRLEISYFSNDDIFLITDKDLISRVLVNIVSNAMRYAEEKSPIRLSFTKEGESHINVSITNYGSYIEESVRDSIFNKFSSVQVAANQAGLQNYGLGLTFSKMAVEAMGGTIWISSNREPPSTTFHFTVQDWNTES